MGNRIVTAAVVILMVLAGCAPAVSASPTPAPPTQAVPTNASTQASTSASVTPAPTEPPSASPSSTPGSTPLPGTATAGASDASSSSCTDSASFVADVTVPDNTSFPQGAAFVKTWRLRNTGTCTWDASYSLHVVTGSQLGGPASIPGQSTPPGSTEDLSVNLVAPGSDGSYTANYELKDGSGQPLTVDGAKYIWVTISVGSAAGLPTASGTSVALGPTTTPASTPVTGTKGSCTYTEDETIINQMFSLINAARTTNGLSTLSPNAKLNSAAMVHSIDMACNSLLSHTGSDGSDPKGRALAQGFTPTYIQEAIYAQPPQYGGTAQAAVDWWLNDPPHRAILLSTKGIEIGLGYADVAGSALVGYFDIEVAAP